MLLFSGTSGIVITLSILCVVQVGGPILVNVTGIIKDVFLTYLGFAFFDDLSPTAMVLAGLVLSFGGAVLALVDKYQQVF